MGEADGGTEVVRIELERLVAVVGGVFELPLGKMADGPLVPGFGKGGSVVDQIGRFVDCLGVVLVLIQPADAGQAVLLLLTAVPPPELANAAVGQEAHAAVAVVHRLAEDGAMRIVAKKADGHDCGPPDDVVAADRQALERAEQIPLANGLDESRGVLRFEVLVVEAHEGRSLVLVHTGAPLAGQSGELEATESFGGVHAVRWSMAPSYGLLNSSLITKGRANNERCGPGSSFFGSTAAGIAGKNGMTCLSLRKRGLMANWHNQLTWAACTWFALFGCLIAEEPKWKTGPEFRQQLAVKLGVTWVEREMRDTLAGISRELDVAVFLDRRIDPGQTINLTLRNQPAEEVLKQLAAAGHAEWRAVGPVVYVGPAETVKKLATVAALRRQEAERLPTEARSRLLKERAWQWSELVEPRQLLDVLAAEGEVKISGMEQAPHDLWPAVSLPPLAWTDRMSLVLAGFDLTFEIADAGNSVRLVSIPAKVVIEKTYSSRGAVGAVVAQLRRATSGAEIRVEQGKIVVAGLQEDQEVVEGLLAGPKGTPAKSTKVKKGPVEKRYSLTAGKNDPAGAIVRTVAVQLGKELKYDANVLEKLKQNVPLSVKEVTLDELLMAVLKPLGLSYKLTDEALEIVPTE